MNYKGTTHLKLEDRRTTEKMLKIKTPVAKIAEALGKCRKTIYNEMARGMCVQQTSEAVQETAHKDFLLSPIFCL